MTSVCRFCHNRLSTSFCDLGVSPLANSYLSAENFNSMEAFYPLHAFVCGQCFLVQVPQFESPENIFRHYEYFSSFSDTWLKHASDYADLMCDRYGIDSGKQVIEIASNDGYLLRFFKKKEVPVLGIEPAVNVAKAAEESGIPTVVEFFSTRLAAGLKAQDKLADLLIANNVLAHVPDLNDFVGGMALLLKSDGILTIEVPHLLRLIEKNQFDTIYHEHFSYFSLNTIDKVFSRHGLKVFDVQELPTHGGSLRVFASRAEASRKVSEQVAAVLDLEEKVGLTALDVYSGFQKKVNSAKRSLLKKMIELKQEGKSIAAYGAPAKGNTLLNFCGVKADFIDYTVDRSPHKQGLFLPGSRIPIYSPEKLKETRPEYIVILPWNIKEEIISQTSFVRDWGGRFIIPIPEVGIVS